MLEVANEGQGERTTRRLISVIICSCNVRTFTFSHVCPPHAQARVEMGPAAVWSSETRKTEAWNAENITTATPRVTPDQCLKSLVITQLQTGVAVAPGTLIVQLWLPIPATATNVSIVNVNANANVRSAVGEEGGKSLSMVRLEVTTGNGILRIPVATTIVVLVTAENVSPFIPPLPSLHYYLHFFPSISAFTTRRSGDSNSPVLHLSLHR